MHFTQLQSDNLHLEHFTNTIEHIHYNSWSAAELPLPGRGGQLGPQLGVDRQPQLRDHRGLPPDVAQRQVLHGKIFKVISKNILGYLKIF